MGCARRGRSRGSLDGGLFVQPTAGERWQSTGSRAGCILCVTTMEGDRFWGRLVVVPISLFVSQCRQHLCHRQRPWEVGHACLVASAPGGCAQHTTTQESGTPFFAREHANGHRWRRAPSPLFPPPLRSSLPLAPPPLPHGCPTFPLTAKIGSPPTPPPLGVAVSRQPRLRAPPPPPHRQQRQPSGPRPRDSTPPPPPHTRARCGAPAATTRR